MTDPLPPDGRGSGGNVGQQVTKLSPDGRILLQLGTRMVTGDGPDQFSSPSDVVVGRNGDIFVIDGHGEGTNERVMKFDSDGNFIMQWGSPGNGPCGVHEFSSLHAIDIDSEGRLFIGDRDNNRIQIYSADGGYLATLIGDATELSPWAQMTVNANIDYIKARARADLEAEWRFRRPTGLTIDDDYRLVIAEAQHNRAQVYLKDVGYEDPQFNL